MFLDLDYFGASVGRDYCPLDTFKYKIGKPFIKKIEDEKSNEVSVSMYRELDIDLLTMSFSFQNTHEIFVNKFL